MAERDKEEKEVNNNNNNTEQERLLVEYIPSLVISAYASTFAVVALYCTNKPVTDCTHGIINYLKPTINCVY